MSDSPSLRTVAWMLIGLTRSVPGVLELADGRLAYSTDDEQLFNEPLDSVKDITFPWYYFGGGVKMTVNDERLRFSFVRPNDQDPYDIPGRMLSRSQDGGAFALLTAGRKVADIGKGRQAGKAWRAALKSQTPASPAPS